MYTDYETIYQTSIIDMFWVYFWIIVFVFLLLLTLFGLSLMFKKASFKQIWAFIPFYNLYKLLEMCGLEKYNLFLIFIPGINIYTLIRLAIEVGDCFSVKTKFKLMLFFLPFIAYPILGFSKIRYVGINNKKVNGIFIEELKKEEVVEQVKSEVIKRDTSIGMGTNEVKKEIEIPVPKQVNEIPKPVEPQELKADVSILNQPKRIDDEYVECPKCHNKVKNNTAICFMCGAKLTNN